MTTTTQLVPLTDRQRQILIWLHGYIADRRYPPTLREICTAFDFKSPNGAMCHLEPLRRKGWLTWEDGKTRTLRITEGCDLGL